MAFPKQLARVLDGKSETMTVKTEADEKAAKMKGWKDDANKDGIPDEPNPGGEYPKDLHGTVKGVPVTKTVKDAKAEAEARKGGWSDTPKQDHGPSAQDLDSDEDDEPDLDKPAPKARKK